MSYTEEKQRQFDEKMDALKRQYKKKRWISRLIWFIYFAVSNVALFVIFHYVDMPALFYALLLVNFMGSIVFLSTALKNWNKQQETQEQLLMEEAPMGRVHFD